MYPKCYFSCKTAVHYCLPVGLKSSKIAMYPKCIQKFTGQGPCINWRPTFKLALGEGEGVPLPGLFTVRVGGIFRCSPGGDFCLYFRYSQKTRQTELVKKSTSQWPVFQAKIHPPVLVTSVSGNRPYFLRRPDIEQLTHCDLSFVARTVDIFFDSSDLTVN